MYINEVHDRIEHHLLKAAGDYVILCNSKVEKFLTCWKMGLSVILRQPLLEEE